MLFDILDIEPTPPTPDEIRAHRNRRPHCASCGGFVPARTLHYVRGDDLRCDCQRCGPDMGVATE